MTFESLLIHTIELENPGTVSGSDRYGNDVLDPPVTTSSPGRVDQNAATEDIIDRDTRITTFTLFLPVTADITALTHVSWDSREFEVVGQPNVLDNAIGPHHIEAILERDRRMTTIDIQFEPDMGGIAELGSSQEMIDAVTEIAEEIAQVVREIGPEDDTAPHYVDMITVESGIEDDVATARVNANKFTSGFIEFGTSDTPTFAPLRRAVDSVGLEFG